MPKELTEEQVIKKWEYKIENTKLVLARKYERMLGNRKGKLDEKESKEFARCKARFLRYMERDIKLLNNSKRKKPKSNLLGVKELTEREKLKKQLPGLAAEVMQLHAKARDTNAYGEGHCICCYRWCSWSELQGGHGKSKSKSLAVRYDERNVNAQRSHCNSPLGGAGNWDAQKPRIDKKWGEGTVAGLERMVIAKERVDPLDVIKKYLPLTLKLLQKKEFDVSKHILRCYAIAKRVGIEL